MKQSIRTPDSERFEYQRRLKAFQQHLPGHLRQVLSSYLVQRTFAGALPYRFSDGRYAQPYWMYLPLWILTGGGSGEKACYPSGTAGDLTWAQVCLFYVFRLQDDVFDDPTRPSELLFVANIFLDEAAAVFARHFSAPHPFWTIYRSSLRKSSDAMVALRNAERDRSHRSAAHAGSIRAVNAILLLGAHAASLLTPHAISTRHIDSYGGAMGLGGQLIDDLSDLEEDVQAERINYAARLLGADRAHTGPAHSSFRDNDIRPVAQRIKSYYRTAERIGREFPHPGPAQYARQCLLWLDDTLRASGARGLCSRERERPAPWPV